MSRSEYSVQLTNEVTCDGCGHAWKPRVRVVKDTLRGEDWSFRCESCQRRFDMVHITPRGIEVRAELNTLRLDTEMDSEAREARIAELEAALAAETTNLARPKEGDDAGNDD